MAVLRVAVLAALVLLATSADVKKDEGVLVGTDANFDAIIAENEYALVEFYAPWCGHCKTLAPEYAKAAQALAEEGSPVVLVKVDATEQTKVAGRFEVQGYPTLKWFRNGEPMEYAGGRTAGDIVSWVMKKSGPPAVDIESVEAAKTFEEKNEAGVLGVFASKDSDEAKAFLEAAGTSELPFGISTDAAVAKEFGLTVPAVVVLKSFDNGNAVYDGDFEAEAIKTFATGESLPLVIEFSDQTAPKIFGGDVKTHLLLFAKSSSDEYKDLADAMSKTAADFKGQILFIFMDADKEDNTRILEYFGITESELPTVRLINIEADMAKFAPEFTEITVENLHGFCSSYIAGTLKRHLLAEDVPEDWNANPVKILTGKNFAEVALDESKFVFVEFYAPWCGHCKQLSPIWDKLAEKYEGTDDVVIAKLDSTGNELEGIKVESFPTIKLFPKGSSEPIDYEGGRTLKAMADFLAEHTGTAVEISDEEIAAAAEGGDEGAEGGEGDYGEEPEYDEDESEDEEDHEEGKEHDEL